MTPPPTLTELSTEDVRKNCRSQVSNRGGGVITPPYNGWYETYEFELDDQLIKADNLNWCL